MAYCDNCGSDIPENSVFCRECDAKIQAEQTKDSFTNQKTDPIPQMTVEDPSESDKVRLCADGKYRWIYEFSMLKNPTIFFTILKILAIGSCVPALLVSLLNLDEGIGAFVSGAEVLGVLLLIMLPLSLLSYFIVAALYGWKYIVLFEMDEKGVTHIQQDKHFKKAQGIAWINMFLGAADNNFSMTGRGLSLMTRNSMTSEFVRVKKVTFKSKRNTIKLNELFSHNQIYVDKSDFEFVRDYIEKRCISAKIK